MRYLKYLALLGVFVVMAATPSPAQVSINVHIGHDYGYYHVPPACPYGYYPDYPFGCAPYGYYGPEYFANGVFIGVGPWYRFYYSQPVLYQRWYGPGYVYFPREHFHRFREHDWDDDHGERFHHGHDGERFFHDHDGERFRHDHDGERFRHDHDGERFRHDHDGERFHHDHGSHGHHHDHDDK